MSGNVSLASLVSRTRSRAGMRNSTLFEDPEVEELIEGSIGELYDVVIAESGPRYWINTTDAQTTVSGTDTYSIYVTGSTPAPIYRIIGVDVQIEGDWRTVRPAQFWEQTLLSGDDGGWGNDPSRIWYLTYVSGEEGPLVTTVERVVRFLPVPRGAHSFRVRYIPAPGDFSTLGASYRLMGLAGWDEYVVCDAASKMLEAQESFEQADRLSLRRDRQEARIRVAAKMLNLDHRDRVRDVSTEHAADPLWPDLRFTY